MLSGRKGCERESLSHINEETQLDNKIQIKILNAVEFDLLFRLNDMFIFAHSAPFLHFLLLTLGFYFGLSWSRRKSSRGVS